MKFKQIFISFLAIQTALIPFTINFQTNAGLTSAYSYLSQLTPSTAQSAAKIAFGSFSSSTKTAAQATGAWTRTAINSFSTSTKTAAQTAGAWAMEKALCLEACGVKGLSSLTVDPGKIYLFLRNNPKWVGASIIGGLAGYIYLKKWNEHQKYLIDKLLNNLNTECRIEDKLKHMRNRTVIDSKNIAQQLEIFPFVPNKIIIKMINEFYLNINQVQDNLKIDKDKIIKELCSPLPL